MKQPDIDRVWETFLRIGQPSNIHSGQHLELMRSAIAPLLVDLQSRGIIGWYSFLIHGNASGVPTVAHDTDSFWHLRVCLEPDIAEETFVASVPPQWEMTRHVPHEEVRRIAGIQEAQLRGDIGKAWQLLGEQGEWLLHVIEACSDELTPLERLRIINQFLHYFANMTQLRIE